MQPTPLGIELAAIAHRLWCAKMSVAGWRHGAVYDEEARTHDALVPFELLGPHDRRLAAIGVNCSGAIELLASAIDYPRGPDREFTIEEMRVGLPVAMGEPPGEPPSTERGSVESWELDRDGDLEFIRVRWPDGDLSTHAPPARELRRV